MGFSPREGYGLHPHIPPHAPRHPVGFSPREGYGLHRKVIFWLFCPSGFSPREGYGLHRQIYTDRSFILQHLVQSIFNIIAQFGNDCNVFCVIPPTFPVGVCIFLRANPFQCMQDRRANMAVRTKNLQGSLNCLFPVADPML